MSTIICEKCKTEFEVDEKEATWKKICLDCYRKAPSKPVFKKASEIKPVNTNGREDCIMRQCAMKCLAMQNDIMFVGKYPGVDELAKMTTDKANALVEYMKNG